MVYKAFLPCVRDKVLLEFFSNNKIKAKNDMRDINGPAIESSPNP